MDSASSYDWHLMGMMWKEGVYIDTALSFGLRSAPKIFNTTAEKLELVMKAGQVHHVPHYLDNYIFLGSPRAKECAASLKKALAVCSELGVPIARHKSVGPLTCITLLGIEVDTRALELRLPREKLEKLKQMFGDWRGRKCCTKRDL